MTTGFVHHDDNMVAGVAVSPLSQTAQRRPSAHLGELDSAKVNQRLARLTPDCQNFVLKQSLQESASRLHTAIAGYLASAMVEPDYAGAAFR